MTTIKQRRGTAAQWTSANPVLAAGEPGFETDTGNHKIGDGTTAWNSLLPANHATYASLPSATDRVIYVSKSAGASDANDGLSWGKAKATVTAALTALGGAGHPLLGYGTWTESVTPVTGTTIEGAGAYLTTLSLGANGTLVDLVGKSDITFKGLTLAATASVTAGTLLTLDDTFGCHFIDVRIVGTSTGATGSFTGQVGVSFINNAGDNCFTDFTIANLGVGASVASQTNYFSQGRFVNCVSHLQGGDATGVVFVAGVTCSQVTFVGAGDSYVNVLGTAGAWHLDECWFDGGATDAIIVGTGTYGPSIFTVTNCPSLTGTTRCLTINATGMVVLDGVRWGDNGSHPTELTINPTNAPYGFAAGLRSAQAFEFASTVFPPLWTVMGRDYLKIPTTINAPGGASFQSASTTAPAAVFNAPGGIGVDILQVQKAGSPVFHVDQFGVLHGAAIQADTGNYLGVNAGSNIYSGSGAPAAGTGSNGDFYLRNDTPGTVNQRIYVKAAGAWTGIL